MNFLFNSFRRNSNSGNNTTAGNNNNNNGAPNANAPQQSQDPCCICLSSISPVGGGQFLISPGCCGKMYHMACLTNYQTAGGTSCPHCRAPFSNSNTLPTPPTPIIQQQQHFPTRINRRSFNAAPTRSTDPTLLLEDPVTPPAKAENNTEKAQTDPIELDNLLSLTMVPEYSIESVAANNEFHVRVSAVYKEMENTSEQRNPLDVVCILDNSGSMSGEKIENLKKAVEFVVSTLSENDRLALITFNSAATVQMALKKMTAANKETTRGVVRSIVANGGTDIYDGMQKGWDILQRRNTTNPATCVFLLTDGQDRSRTEEKYQLARNIRQSGAPLFVFGFGADHDSEHMTNIANAAEGSFIYIETNDTVIDAFGGAIGSQQGFAMRSIEVSVRTLGNGVSIQEVQAGSYATTLDTAGNLATVRLSDLYSGERRDFLLRLRLPAIDREDNNYQLVVGSAKYELRVRSNQETSQSQHEVSSEPCCIVRVGKGNLPASRERDVNVDADIFRFRVASAIASALQAADRGDFSVASSILTAAKKALETESVALRAKLPVALSLVEDIDISLERVTNRSAYNAGGRAMMSEALDGHSKQRMVYKKAAKMAVYQTVTSSSAQSRAFSSKSGF